MLRLRFSSGLILGLILGLVAGASLILLSKRPPGTEQESLVLQVQDLSRRLEDTRGERDRLLQQLEQFEKLSAQMTAGLSGLEQRMSVLQAEYAAAQRRQVEPTAAPTTGRDPTPTQPVPTAAPTQAPTADEPLPELPASEDDAETPPAPAP